VKVVLDTNVIVSALIVSDSLPNKALSLAQAGTIELIVSTPLLSELQGVLTRRHIKGRLGWSDDEVRRFVEWLRRAGSFVEPESRLYILTDDADNRFLEAATAGEADYIVTGDTQMLALAKYEGVQIVTPAQFVAILAALPPQ
jgi:putative PIN family toxin of toxin-antitoxin system